MTVLGATGNRSPVTGLNQQKLTEEQLILAQSKFHRDSLLNVRSVISNEEMETSRNTYLQSLMACENMHSSLNSMQIQIGQLKESLLDTGHQDIETLNSLQTQLQTQFFGISG
jgi:multidrug resistance efflux pump